MKERTPGMEVWPGAIEETFALLQEQWPTKGKKQEQVRLAEHSSLKHLTACKATNYYS